MLSADALPTLLPLGDAGLVVRFGTSLSDLANRRAVAAARRFEADRPEGVVEVAAGLVSVLLRLHPGADFWRVSGEVRLRLQGLDETSAPSGHHCIAVQFGGEDLEQVAAVAQLSPARFIAAHNAAPLRVLATGFAPGFVYCGFHPPGLVLPRRAAVRPMVPAGSVLFAAGQTAIAATPIRTGWHWIGRTEFQNFDPQREPPNLLRAGDTVSFVPA